ncbi:DUF1223 domain-containing protein [Vibrio hannami]|uniref:DUF1223 domain-containing protein n=1 Tax=Vibrio hannami TaxID=2717094 RepID=UPI00240FFAC9|nr:DUF1223 domain-containing protein [Vibrio hannami]MDG3086248.1 DUF1223 domain-containing protein [Vibrio hannami]
MFITFGLQQPALADQIWQHEGKPAQLIELFTSEGCSSCPPADKYLSQFQSASELWTEVIPLAFLVDYWNYLGWSDKFAHPSYSQRQRIYQSLGASSSVYTPGFIVDGREWRGYFYRSDLPKSQQVTAEKLTLKQSGNRFEVSYPSEQRYIAHIVILAMDEETEVKAGENRGRKLEHDFVVLRKEQKAAQSQWTFNLRSLPENRDAVAVWLTKEDGFLPVQTVAGYFH